MLTAFGLAVFRLGDAPLWLDEATTFVSAHLPASEIPDRLAQQNHPAAYFLLMHGWVKALGGSEFWFRMPSTIFFVLTIPMVYAIGRAAANARAGIFAAFLVATTPYWINFAQEARSHTMLTFFATAALLCLTHLLTRHAGSATIVGSGLHDAFLRLAKKEGRPRRDDAVRRDLLWLAYVVACVCAMATHHNAILLPGIAALAFAVSVTLARDARKASLCFNFAVANLLIAAAYSGLLPYFIRSLDRLGNVGYYAPFPDFLYLAGTMVATYFSAVDLSSISASDLAAPGALGLSTVSNLLPGLLAILLHGVVIAWAIRQSPTNGKAHATALSLLSWLGLPALLWVVSVLFVPILAPRNLSWSCIPFAVLCGIGLSWMRPKAFACALFGVALVYNVAGVFREYDNVHTRWDDLAELIAREASPHDAVLLCPGYLINPFNYYWRVHGRDVARYEAYAGGARRFTASPDDHPSRWADHGWATHDVAALPERHPKLWLVFRGSRNCDRAAIRAALARDARGEHAFGRSRVLEYSRNGDAPSARRGAHVRAIDLVRSQSLPAESKAVDTPRRLATVVRVPGELERQAGPFGVADRGADCRSGPDRVARARDSHPLHARAYDCE